MGQLVDGDWVDGNVATPRDTDGRFIRQQARFRRWICGDGSTPFPPEPGRYHLYLASACPWCHRVDIARSLKGLEAVISRSYVHPLMLEGGWRFAEGYEDPLYGLDYAHQLYQRADPAYTGRVTVPVLWDRATDQPVSNESSEILRMLDMAFGELADDRWSLYPEALRPGIDRWNERIYGAVNNGVYRCGFAGSQEAYEEAFSELFATLDALEAHLEGRTWLVGDQLTEADLRLLAPEYGVDHVAELMERKRAGAEYGALGEGEAHAHAGHLDALTARLEAAHERCTLPTDVTNFDALDDFVVRARMELGGG